MVGQIFLIFDFSPSNMHACILCFFDSPLSHASSFCFLMGIWHHGELAAQENAGEAGGRKGGSGGLMAMGKGAGRGERSESGTLSNRSL